MNVGKMRLVVTLQSKSDSRDSFGAVTSTWSTAATVRGEWVQGGAGGLESFVAGAGREVQRTARKMRIRFDSGIALTELNRAVVDSVTYDIERVVDPDGRRREWQLDLQELT